MDRKSVGKAGHRERRIFRPKDAAASDAHAAEAGLTLLMAREMEADRRKEAWDASHPRYLLEGPT